MEHELQLTARGYAVCELMVEQGLSMEEACEHVERALFALRQRLDAILAGSSWEEVPHAVQLALNGVSSHVQSAYLDEQRSTARSDFGVSA